MEASTTINSPRRTYWFAGATVALAIGLSFAQNLKLLPNPKGMEAFGDLLQKNCLIAVAWLIFVVGASFLVFVFTKKTMGNLVSLAMSAVVGASCFLAYDPLVGALLGGFTGSVVAWPDYGKGFKDVTVLLVPAFVVGFVGTMVLRDFSSPWRWLGPLLWGAFFVWFVWKKWPSPFRVTFVIPCAISLATIWFSLTVDTFLRVPSVDCLEWSTDNWTRLTNGLLDVRYVWGADSSNDLYRLRSYGNIRTIGVHSEKSGDGLEWVKNPDGVVHLNISAATMSNEAAAALRRFTGLQRLWMWGAQMDEGCLQYLDSMSRLSSLRLDGTNVSDASLRHLLRVPTLTALHLNRTPISDVGLENLRGHPGLTCLDLRETRATGSSLPSLVSGQLEIELFMSKTKVTDETASNFVVLNRVPAVKLDLSDTAITDDALIYLGKITTLVELELAGTNVSDEGLQHLTNLKSLVSLNIAETKCTPAGIRKLESALPKVDVAWFE